MAPDHLPATPHPDLEPVLNWAKLARRDELELVHRSGKTLASGRVDMLAEDGSVFWIIQGDGRGRTMVLPDDNIIVYRHRRARNDRSRSH